MGVPVGICGDLVGRDLLEVVAIDPELAQLSYGDREPPPMGIGMLQIAHEPEFGRKRRGDEAPGVARQPAGGT